MKSRQRTVETAVIGVMFFLICAATSQANAPAGAASRRVINLHHTVAVEKKTFDIEVVRFDLTGNCQLRLELQNKGSILTKEQHRNSTLQVGQNTPFSLSVIDPGRRLCAKNGTATYIEAKPIAKETDMKVSLTLFNGDKKTWTKMLRPTCGKARLNSEGKRNTGLQKGGSGPVPGSSRMINPQPEPPGKHGMINPQPEPPGRHVKPVPGSSKMINPQPEPPGKQRMFQPQPEPPGKEMQH